MLYYLSQANEIYILYKEMDISIISKLPTINERPY